MMTYFAAQEWIAPLFEYLHQVISYIERYRFLLELVVLLFISFETYELRKHRKALQSHETQLNAVRPILSSLYTTSEEIMELSISFIKEAKEICALGSIRSLIDTERKPDETEAAFEERVSQLNPKIRELIAATENSILRGCKYSRIIDFRPIDSSDDAVLEVLSNINFFRRLMNFRGTHLDMRLELYHSSEIIRGRGDYHFRCNDQRVELRIGGHGNTSSNAAIVITDTRVVSQYRLYYESLIESGLARPMTLDDLIRMNDLLITRDVEGVEKYLAARQGQDLADNQLDRLNSETPLHFE